MNFISEIIIWLLAWGVGMGTYYAFFRPVHLNYHNHTFVNMTWYSSAIFVAFIIFSEELLPLVVNADASIITFFFFFPVFLLLYFKEIFLNPGDEDGIKYKKYLFSKILEILFQQEMFVAGLYIFSGNALYFAIFFCLAHLPLVFFVEPKYAWLFIAVSPFGGYTFAYLILNIQNGIFYSFSVHVIFYIILNYLSYKKVLPLNPSEI